MQYVCEITRYVFPSVISWIGMNIGANPTGTKSVAVFVCVCVCVSARGKKVGIVACLPTLCPLLFYGEQLN
jgi:hypothetical protein